MVVVLSCHFVIALPFGPDQGGLDAEGQEADAADEVPQLARMTNSRMDAASSVMSMYYGTTISRKRLWMTNLPSRQ